MTEPRLATHMLVASLIRRTQSAGDFAAVLHKGDKTAGNILIIGLEKGANPRLFERYPMLSGGLMWERVSAQSIDKSGDMTEYLARRRKNDPDLWVVELDVAFPERLAELLDMKA
jgi:hypothetical protein